MVTQWETVAQCAERLSVSKLHLRKLMADGHIPFYRIGKRRIALNAHEVDRTIEEKFRNGGQ